MDFQQVTTQLISGPTLKDLARDMGSSPGVLALCRLDPNNPGHRRAPTGWQGAVLKLARRRAKELDRLVNQLARAVASAPARTRKPAKKATRRAKVKTTARKRAVRRR